LVLAERTKESSYVDDMAFGERNKSGYAAKTKSRLVNDSRFPGQLGVLIIPAGRGSQRLDLAPSEIRLSSWRAWKNYTKNRRRIFLTTLPLIGNQLSKLLARM
jgi:hypothetical protein